MRLSPSQSFSRLPSGARQTPKESKPPRIQYLSTLDLCLEIANYCAFYHKSLFTPDATRNE